MKTKIGTEVARVTRAPLSRSKDKGQLAGQLVFYWATRSANAHHAGHVYRMHNENGCHCIVCDVAAVFSTKRLFTRLQQSLLLQISFNVSVLFLKCHRKLLR